MTTQTCCGPENTELPGRSYPRVPQKTHERFARDAVLFLALATAL